ncbi:hypothetical protein V8D89_002834 [Ganoderma adspersum]
MYVNTPSSAHSTRTVASQAPSTPLHAPRMGAHGLPPPPHVPASPMTPHGGAYAPFPVPHPTGGHTIAYGLMTPPDSPDKPTGRGQDLHPLLDARSPQLLPGFDVRRGALLKADVLQSPVVNHPVRLLRVNMGPFTLDIANTGGSIPTVQDLVYGFMRTLSAVPASPQEMAAAVQMGLAHPGLPQQGVSRGMLLDLRPFFGGFTLRAVQQGVAIVDCHLRARP